MYGKKWTLTDADGNHPTEEEVALFLGWLRCEESCPVTVTTQALGPDGKPRAQFSFQQTDDRPTIKSTAAMLHRQVQKTRDAEERLELVRNGLRHKNIEAIAEAVGMKVEPDGKPV